ncbi:MAG: substrate-binding domain-containing protein [Phycisphaerae bacterium]
MTQVKHHGVPLVGTFASQDCPDIARVLPDSEAIGAMVGRYFLRLGFRHFLYVGTEDRWFSRQRQEGFAATLAAQGCDCRTVLMGQGARRWAQSIRKLDQLLKETRKPLAAMTCVDNQAAIVLELRKEMRLHEVLCCNPWNRNRWAVLDSNTIT